MFIHRFYPFQRPEELDKPTEHIYDVVVVGAGPVGLTLTLALARQGVAVLLLDDNNRVSDGSRALCFSKRSLEIFDKLGVAKPMMEKGVCWNVGRIFFHQKEIDCFDLTPDQRSKHPAFINLPQYYVEDYLIKAASDEQNVEIRWLNKLVEIEQQPAGHVTIQVETPEGTYSLYTKILVACDGSQSSIRHLMNLRMQEQHFEERFLIVDFRMEADFPAERWYWFYPPFAKEQSIMLLKQPDNLWRLDIKLGKDASTSLIDDRQFIKDKISSLVGHRSFELDWTSIYSYSSKMLERFVHDQVIFAGDSAHIVSPFGARGANGGIEDADNLSWKLATVLKGQAEASLVETYNAERTAAARQNIASTSESNLFIAPPSKAATWFRNEILEKAGNDPLAKKQINCGRLSVPCIYGKYPDSEQGDWPNPELSPGRAVKDCKMADGFLIDKLGYCFTVLTIENTFSKPDIATLQQNQIKIVEVIAEQNQDLVSLYKLHTGSGYLLSPDLYVVGRWKSINYKSMMALYQKYLSGEVPELYEWQKSEQEIIDREVASKIMELSHENQK